MVVCAADCGALTRLRPARRPGHPGREERRRGGRGRAGIADVKAIAEEGFIYGLPIVMNYAVMNEYAIDRDSGQFKAPFNEIKNEPRVFTYKDTAIVTPNSDTPYSLAVARPSCGADRAFGAGGRKYRYYSVMLNDVYTFNYGYIGSRATGNEAGDYLVAGPRLEGRDAAGDQEGVPLDHRDFSLAAYRTQLFDADDMDERDKGPGWLQGPAAVRVSEAAGAAGGTRRSTGRKSTRRRSRPISSSTWTSRCSSLRPGRRKRPSARSSRHRHRGGQKVRLRGPLARTQGGGSSRA